MDAPTAGGLRAGEDALPLVVVAEDDATLRDLLVQVLEDEVGVRVVAASNGQRLLDVVPRTVPALIVMDVRMPVMGGLEAARRLRADPLARGIPIIAISAVDERGAVEAAGCAFVPKPFELEELIDGITGRLRAISAASGPVEGA